MPPPVTCASGPNHSDVLRLENSTLFLFHLLHGTLSAWTSLSSCHNLQDMIPSAGHDFIMVIVDSITKRAHFISTVTTISCTRAAYLFLNHVWKHHNLPRRVVSDRGPQFIAEFTQELYRLLGIKLAATTAYHPQGDGQTERVVEFCQTRLGRYQCNSRLASAVQAPCKRVKKRVLHYGTNFLL